MVPHAAEDPPYRPSGLVRALDALADTSLLLYAACLVFLMGTVYADVRTGGETVLTAFYLVPVAVLAWGKGLAAGLVGAFVSAGTAVGFEAAHAGEAPSAAAVWNDAMVLVSSAGVAWAFSRLRANHVEILRLLDSERRLAREDALTGLASSRAFYERLTLEIERMKRHEKPMSLLYLDLDEFKLVNDEHGHRVGDLVLERLGRVLRAKTRTTDLCARLGGDEFAVLMPETAADAAYVVAQRIREGALQSFREVGPAVGVSAGLGTFSRAPVDAEAPMHLVDQLMYEAKRTGKNRIVERAFA
jgi:diguanylate cyclase (GGDEF)-like protein